MCERRRAKLLMWLQIIIDSENFGNDGKPLYRRVPLRRTKLRRLNEPFFFRSAYYRVLVSHKTEKSVFKALMKAS